MTIRTRAFEHFADRGLVRCEDIARVVGLSLSTVWRVKEGLQEPSKTFINGSIAYLKMDYNDLFYVEPDPEPAAAVPA